MHQKKAAPRPLGDRITTFMDDMKSKVSERVKTVLTRVLMVIKSSQPDIDLAGLPGKIVNENQGVEHEDEAQVIAELLVGDNE